MKEWQRKICGMKRLQTTAWQTSVIKASDKQIDRQTDKQTDIQTNRQTVDKSSSSTSLESCSPALQCGVRPHIGGAGAPGVWQPTTAQPAMCCYYSQGLGNIGYINTVLYKRTITTNLWFLYYYEPSYKTLEHKCAGIMLASKTNRQTNPTKYFC